MTLNEVPNFDKVHNETFFVDLFEIGLLHDRSEPAVGVSPDVIAVITIKEETQVAAYLEIKTRVATTTVDLVESAMKEHGRIVWYM